MARHQVIRERGGKWLAVLIVGIFVQRGAYPW